MKQIRTAFGEELVQAGRDLPNVVAVSCDLKKATKSDTFFKTFPERSFEVGIAEANAIGVAAGLALSGYRPFLSSFGAFLTGKNVEIRTSIAYNEAPVVLVGTHGGMIGPDGATQAALQDIAVMRSIPGMKVYQPCCPIEAALIVHHVARTRDMVYIRCARNAVPPLTLYNRFEPGRAYMLVKSDDSVRTVISSGPLVYNCIQAAKDLGSVNVINMPSIFPFDDERLARWVEGQEKLFVVEDHSTRGGLGSAVLESLARSNIHISVDLIGIDDFIVSGTPAELEKKFGLDKEGLKCRLSC